VTLWGRQAAGVGVVCSLWAVALWISRNTMPVRFLFGRPPYRRDVRRLGRLWHVDLAAAAGLPFLAFDRFWRSTALACSPPPWTRRTATASDPADLLEVDVDHAGLRAMIRPIRNESRHWDQGTDAGSA
jgi:hypothetical protein